MSDSCTNEVKMIDTMKPLIMEIIKENKNFIPDEKIYFDFFETYPGLCYSAKDEIYFPDGSRDVAPCINKVLCVDYEGIDQTYETNLDKYKVKSNMILHNLLYISLGKANDTIFGEYTRLSLKCPHDTKNGKSCEVAHYGHRLKITEKHIAMRKKINSKVWQYDELLVLWQKFYDKHMDELVEKAYMSHFAIYENQYIETIKDCHDACEQRSLLQNKIKELIENM